jgi:hypothetical protein
MNDTFPRIGTALVIAFIAGFGTHFLYKRWNLPGEQLAAANFFQQGSPRDGFQPQNHPVTFIAERRDSSLSSIELPMLEARDVEKIRGLTGNRARIRGRVFRIGHSAKSNTYFLNFGPSREALTAVIFASAVESFEKRSLAPKGFEGKEIEIEGVVKDHPQYGLEVILETPGQIKIVN